MKVDCVVVELYSMRYIFVYPQTALGPRVWLSKTYKLPILAFERRPVPLGGI